MRALLVTKHGSVNDLEFTDSYPAPTAGPGDVVLRVRATSLNRHDLFTLRGMPGITLDLPVVPGLDVAGEIVQLGDDVSGWSVGDRAVVFPLDDRFGLVGETRDGGLAEFIAIPATQLIAIPSAVTFAQAAALPVAYGTAQRMIVDKGTVAAGDTVLVLGASGGVGTAAVVLAKSLGARVAAAVGSEEKRQALLAAGADWAVNTSEEDVFSWARKTFGKPSRTSESTGVDVVVNFTGGSTWNPTLRIVRRGGRILVCGATDGFDPQEDLRYVWTFELQIIGSNGFTRDGVESLLAQVAGGNLAPVIHSVSGLESARGAFADLDERRIIGKVVVTQDGETR